MTNQASEQLQAELDKFFNTALNAKQVAVDTADKELMFGDNAQIAEIANALLARYRQETIAALLKAFQAYVVAVKIGEEWSEHEDMTNIEQSPTPNWIFGHNTGLDNFETALLSGLESKENER